MTTEQIMVNLFNFSAPTYYKWHKKEKREIFKLLNYAFSKENLEEFLETGKIKKFEDFKNIENSYKVIDDILDEIETKLYRYTHVEMGWPSVVYRLLLFPRYYQDVYEKNDGDFQIERKINKISFFDFMQNTTFDEIDDNHKIFYLKLLNEIDDTVFKLLAFKYSSVPDNDVWQIKLQIALPLNKSGV